VIKTNPHHSLIQKLLWAYTTSANPSGKNFDGKFAASVADVIVRYPLPEKQKTASSIYKINNTKIKRMR